MSAAPAGSGSDQVADDRHVVLPLAIPGLVTGVILTAGRVFGEAAVLLFTSGIGPQRTTTSRTWT